MAGTLPSTRGERRATPRRARLVMTVSAGELVTMRSPRPDTTFLVVHCCGVMIGVGTKPRHSTRSPDQGRPFSESLSPSVQQKKIVQRIFGQQRLIHRQRLRGMYFSICPQARSKASVIASNKTHPASPREGGWPSSSSNSRKTNPPPRQICLCRLCDQDGLPSVSHPPIRVKMI